MRKTSAFVAGILDGMGSPAGLFMTVKYPRPSGSDLDRLRGDVKKVGADFNRVIQREHGKTNKSK